MVFSLALKDGRAFFRNRFVRTAGFLAEQAARRPLLRTTFSKGAADGGRLFNPFDLTFKNVANTGVLHWGGKLYALWEVRTGGGHKVWKSRAGCILHNSPA